VRTPDILAEVAAHAPRPRLVVGFAAETHDVARYARDKLARKRVDMIAANQVGIAGGGFEGDDNTLTVFDGDGEPRARIGIQGATGRGIAGSRRRATALIDMTGAMA
jgi:phosphopantothenoylcysteine synthetase/decarboxylase